MLQPIQIYIQSDCTPFHPKSTPSCFFTWWNIICLNVWTPHRQSWIPQKGCIIQRKKNYKLNLFNTLYLNETNLGKVVYPTVSPEQFLFPLALPSKHNYLSASILVYFQSLSSLSNKALFSVFSFTAPASVCWKDVRTCTSLDSFSRNWTWFFLALILE